MPDFLQRFGELQPDGSYGFSTVRSGLIVGLLSIGTLVGALIAAPFADKFRGGHQYVFGASLSPLGSSSRSPRAPPGSSS